MSKTINEKLVSFLKWVENRYNTKPIAIYIKDVVDLRIYMWKGETTLDYFLKLLTLEDGVYGFHTIIWFDNGDYAECEDDILDWDHFHHVPKIEDYFGND